MQITPLLLGYIGATIAGSLGFAAICWRLSHLRRQGGNDWHKPRQARRTASIGILFGILTVFTTVASVYMALPPELGLSESSNTPVGTTLLAMIILLATTVIAGGVVFAIFSHFTRGMEFDSEGSGG